MARPRNGMTLLEVLVVCSIMGFLIVSAFPAIHKVRAAADRAACQNNLRQMGQALHVYHHDHGSFPPPAKVFPKTAPENNVSWLALLLPYIDQRPLYNQTIIACEQSQNPFQVPPHTGVVTIIRTYVCPSDGRLLSARTDDWGTTAAYGSYLAAAGGRTPDHRPYLGPLPGCRLEEIFDGPSNTICVGERPPPDSGQGGWWYPLAYIDTRGHRGPNTMLVIDTTLPYYPFDTQCAPTYRVTGPGRTANPCDRFHFWSLHGGGANFLFVDGAVRFLSYSADPIMPALISIHGGEAVTLPD